MKKILGIVGGGMIGRDPFDDRCWSGSSKNFFLACDKAGMLGRAFGVEVPSYCRYPLILKNYSTNMRMWRGKFNLDTMYYAALTKEIGKNLRPEDMQYATMQIGAIYDVPSLVHDRTKCYSYHDGNLIKLMSSPFFNSDLRPYSQKALAWEKRVYDGMTKIFTMSEYLRKSFIDDFGQDADKVVNVGVGANFEVPSNFTKDYSGQDIIFIGIDFERKGGDTLVLAFDEVSSRFPNARLHIIGPKKTPTILNDGRNRNNVVFHGFLSRLNDTHRKIFFDLMAKGTIGILPSLYEPFGISLIEAMYYKMPCIATNNWAFPEFVINDFTGLLVSPDSVSELACAIEYYLSSQEVRRVHGENARQLVESTYSWDHVVKNISNSVQ